LATVTLIRIVAPAIGMEAWPWLAERDELTLVLLAGGVVAFVSILRAVNVVRPRSFVL
jgi:hypothetical protein